MFQHRLRVSRLVCGVALIAIGTAQGTSQERPGGTDAVLAISIAVPDRVEDSTARAIYATDKSSRFHVILTNRGREPFYLPDRGSEPGREALRFEIIDELENMTIARRVSILTSRRGRVGSWLLRPGESVVIEVDFLNTDNWRGFPKLGTYGQVTKVQMRAIFEIEPESVPKDSSFWTGRAETEGETFSINSRISGVSRGIGGVVQSRGEFGTVNFSIEAEGPDDALTLKQLMISGSRGEIRVPTAAMAGIRRPLLGTLVPTIESDVNGRELLCFTFEVDDPPTGKDVVGRPRVSFAFQDGAFVKRTTFITRKQIVDEWPAKNDN
ncbi:hypothetical protein [Planctomyces sp. SH-PL14]|uniref:hypothetical protein n=1 Tax=Planctomyces sp. SH-PL14 TaxID=1632864 RepID=UPI00078CD04D|nr:hypothetical protein [Planctomyces sp. SH-PL14]AMV16423.1 hypothetical protein VT03_00945 [Planctomyces sp. SH-PL14]